MLLINDNFNNMVLVKSFIITYHKKYTLMVKVRYESTIPPFEISYEIFKELSQIMLKEGTPNAKQEIAIKDGNFIRFYSSIDEIFNDPNRPRNIVLESWKVRLDDEVISMIESSHEGYTVMFFGDENSVKEKVKLLEKFTKKYELDRKKIDEAVCSKVVYEDELPLFQITEESLKELESILLKDLPDNTEQSITIKIKDLKKTYKSVDDIFKDLYTSELDLNSIVIEDWSISCDYEILVMLLFHKSMGYYTIKLTGNEDIIRKKVKLLRKFIEKYKIKKPKKIDYESRLKKELPPIRIPAEALKELEDVLSIDCEEPETGLFEENSIDIKINDFQKTYHSFEELINDPLAPNEIVDFHIKWYCRRGSIEILSSSDFLPIFNIELRGDDNWVISKAKKLTDFFSKYRSNIIIRFLHNSYFRFIESSVGFALIFIAIGNLIKTANLFYNTFLIISGLIFLIFGICLEKIVPFAVIEFRENKFRKYLEQLLIGIIASAIVTMIFGLLPFLQK